MNHFPPCGDQQPVDGDVMNKNRLFFAARARRTAPIAAVLAVVVLAGSAGQASAQGLFGLFGSPARDPAPAPAMSYGDPVAPPASTRPASVPAAPSAGRTVTYCVRLCDGRHFPIQNASPATAAAL